MFVCVSIARGLSIFIRITEKNNDSLIHLYIQITYLNLYIPVKYFIVYTHVLKP